MNKHPFSISPQDYQEYFDYQGLKFKEAGLLVKHGNHFNFYGKVTELALLERKLRFNYPKDYIDVITENDYSNVHFRSGWWKVKNTPNLLICWSFSLILSIFSAPGSEDKENTLLVYDKLKKLGIAGIPFGEGFRIQKDSMQLEDGWLYFNQMDKSVWFIDFKGNVVEPVANNFSLMMHNADFTGF